MLQVLVQCKVRDSFGSGFVIRSDDGGSIILIAAHASSISEISTTTKQGLYPKDVQNEWSKANSSQLQSFMQTSMQT